jgi:hypothetical protein
MITGGSIRLEANRARRDRADDSAIANAIACGIEGTISPAGEADFALAPRGERADLRPSPTGRRELD